jgi:hypothetical protein
MMCMLEGTAAGRRGVWGVVGMVTWGDEGL